ncbi:hypothetical protein L1887_28434 [Cichorium endivia]|nr:hypothetical protein L1887_28434 [Cichorium endivia]
MHPRRHQCHDPPFITGDHSINGAASSRYLCQPAAPPSATSSADGAVYSSSVHEKQSPAMLPPEMINNSDTTPFLHLVLRLLRTFTIAASPPPAQATRPVITTSSLAYSHVPATTPPSSSVNATQ